ncbi:hypothetical protein [Sulfitobacter sp. EhC04]|uniref:hypothetical protein n=1 Tax=Sulfitobacter sp. EhC04 TaxID=1849168 RepID=UPI0010FF377F|nr:hypothetical protein [Sulfitobacter sp. EhC04]
MATAAVQDFGTGVWVAGPALFGRSSPPATCLHLRARNQTTPDLQKKSQDMLTGARALPVRELNTRIKIELMKPAKSFVAAKIST